MSALLEPFIHEPRIACFSMEIALRSEIPAYSGGLGVLAGDTMRSAADLHLPMITRRSTSAIREQRRSRRSSCAISWAPWWARAKRAWRSSSLAGYVALRLVGREHGALLLGLFGGQGSSTPRETSPWRSASVAPSALAPADRAGEAAAALHRLPRQDPGRARGVCDAAGKDGAIKRIVEHLSPRETPVVALG